MIIILPTGAFAGSVSLRWRANTEPDISSYYIYYGTKKRSYNSPIPVGNKTAHTVKGLDDGTTYYFAVTALDTSGNESGYSSEVSAKAYTSQPSSAALTASLSSPQTEGTTVRFTASASGGSGNYEYQFLVQGPHTDGKWSVEQAFSSSPTFDWRTAGKPGDNTIVVWCRSAGTTPDYTEVAPAGAYFTVAAKASTPIPQPSSAALAASPSSPQIKGTTVRFTASASGGSGNYEYQFLVKGPHTNGKWDVEQAFSSANTFDWNTTGKTGDNTIVVWCRNAGTQPDHTEVTPAGAYYTVTANQGSYSIVLSTSSDRSNPMPLSNQTVSGDVYIFILPETGISQVSFDLDGNYSHTERLVPYDFGKPTQSTTNLSNGSHTVTANITLSDNSVETISANFDYTSAIIPQPSSASLAALQNSPQFEGATVQFTASASGGSGSYEYQFLVKGPHTNGRWDIEQAFSSANTFDWDTTGKSGENTIVVWTRSAGTQPDYTEVTPAGQYFDVIPSGQNPSGQNFAAN